MLRFLFWTLLLANVGLFAYRSGYLETWFPDGRDPDRMSRQFNADKMKPIAAGAIVADAGPASTVAPDSLSAAASSTTAGSSTSTIASTPSTTVADSGQKDAKPGILGCAEVGNFDAVAAKRFEAQMQPLASRIKPVRRNIVEVAGNMVYIPSQGSKDAAAKKSAELLHLGIHDFYVIQDEGPLHWGISLGVFKTEDAARIQMASLNQKGVHSAHIGVHNVTTNKVAFQLHGLDSDAKAGLDKIMHGFPNIVTHACTPDTAADSRLPPGDSASPQAVDAAPDRKANIRK